VSLPRQGRSSKSPRPNRPIGEPGCNAIRRAASMCSRSSWSRAGSRSGIPRVYRTVECRSIFWSLGRLCLKVAFAEKSAFCFKSHYGPIQRPFCTTERPAAQQKPRLATGRIVGRLPAFGMEPSVQLVYRLKQWLKESKAVSGETLNYGEPSLRIAHQMARCATQPIVGRRIKPQHDYGDHQGDRRLPCPVLFWPSFATVVAHAAIVPGARGACV